ncbi:MAG TPA: SpoIID/LytB domain-containing protein [Candidatus Acidoferrales bacterium]|nr:SpoIID/LytB domain-containing protein [Candidatus Acidoferrales bacterium]
MNDPTHVVMSWSRARSDDVRLGLTVAISLVSTLIALGSVVDAVPGAASVTPAPSGRAVGAARGVARVSAPETRDVVQGAHRSATYAASSDPIEVSSNSTIPVTVRNLGDGVWEAAGERAVALSYHLYDSSGALVAWDGVRTALSADIAPGGSAVVQMAFAAPARTGAYTVSPDLVRDGAGGWFSKDEAPAGKFTLHVTDALDAGYGPTTSPAIVIPGAEVPVEVNLSNTGLAPWSASGDHPVHVSYHWLALDGTPVIWDGARNSLGHDVAPGEAVQLAVAVRAPEAEGTYLLVWDLVKEGVGWFSGHGVTTKVEEVTVSRSVTFYGKGWGHGIGLSQWGAQGWAEGATGVRLSGEQIVQHYFPLATLGTQPATKPFRVLLSYPSTGCVGRTIFNTATMSSAGGMRLVNDADPSVVYDDLGPYDQIRFGVYGGTTLVAVDVRTRRTVYAGDNDSLTLVPTQWWDPIAVREKDLEYRGNILVQVRDEGELRVVNYVNSDDYMMGALPGEMPSRWEMEALRAQAITARTYVAWRQATAGDRTWDVRDDTADQCYGGHSFESPRTTAAVKSTAATILTYAGQPIRALYSSANGGVTENVGCLLDAERVGDTWKCADGWPYLSVVDDPAELVAYDNFGGMPYVGWSFSFSADTVRREILEDFGYDIGQLIAIGFNESPGGRPISVRVQGTLDTVDLKGDRFLRSTLGLPATLVKTFPF